MTPLRRFLRFRNESSKNRINTCLGKYPGRTLQRLAAAMAGAWLSSSIFLASFFESSVSEGDTFPQGCATITYWAKFSNASPLKTTTSATDGGRESHT